MRYVLIIIQLGILLTLYGCKKTNKNSYAIKDFDKELQPYLIQVVSKGIVGYDSASSFIKHNATDDEIEKLSRSEHPVLRAVAFRIMLERNTFNHFDLIMNHLDDTAVVVADDGEFGINYYTISDDMLNHAEWKNVRERTKTIEEIILHHNYLHSAYYKLLDIQPKPEYYSSIKAMALQSRDQNPAQRGFEEIEYALYALAKYQRNENIQLIKTILLKNDWRMSDLSFRLMKDYPNESYLDIFERYFQRHFYHIACQNNGSDNLATVFINSVATYKTERSARILESIFNKSPFSPCPPANFGYSKLGLAYEIWDNKCEAYSNLRKQSEVLVKADQKKRKIILEVGPAIPSPETMGPVSWWAR